MTSRRLREDLNVTPREADQVRLKGAGRLAKNLSALACGVQGKIENMLSNIRPAPMNEVRQVGHADGVDFYRWQALCR